MYLTWFQSDSKNTPQKKEGHLIFMNFEVKKFIIKRPLKKNLMFEYYNVVHFIKQGIVFFWD